MISGRKQQHTEDKDDELNDNDATNDEKDGVDVDPDALAFIKAKKKVNDLHKAKKHD